MEEVVKVLDKKFGKQGGGYCKVLMYPAVHEVEKDTGYITMPSREALYLI
jgi:hypothetical protein